MSVGHTGVTTSEPREPVIVCETPQDECGVRDVLDRLGDKWSVYVIVELASECGGSRSCSAGFRAASRSAC